MEEEVKDSGDDILPRMTPASVLEIKMLVVLEKARSGVCVGGEERVARSSMMNFPPPTAVMLAYYVCVLQQSGCPS